MTPPSRVHVWLRTPGGAELALGPGDLVGRSWCASLHLDDPRVSEAHALVSLRGDTLKLLALRGRLRVGGAFADEVELVAGLEIDLAPGVAITVVDVLLPDAVVALEGDHLPRTTLHGAAAIALRPDPVVVHPTARDAVAWLWMGPGGWRLRTLDGTQQAVDVGDPFDVDDHGFRLVRVPRQGAAPTVGRPRPSSGLRIVARYETVHVHRPGGDPCVLDGLGARLVSELVAFGVPVAWTTLAAELWPDVDDEVLRRKRLDGALARLRSRLRDHGVRTDLVRSNGLGHYELLLEPDDVVEDQL